MQNKSIMRKAPPADASENSMFVQQFTEAVQNGDTEFVRQNVKHKEIITCLFSPEKYTNLLIVAINNKDATMVALLLKLKSHIRINSCPNSYSPLWIALIYDQVEIIKLIVEAGADLKARMGLNMLYDPESSVIHFLTISDYLNSADLIDIMINQGADVDALDSQGKTALYYAVEMNHTMIASKLISKGADVNFKEDSTGLTPILLASKNIKRVDMIALLINHGADVYARCNQGFNVLHYLAKADTECIDAAELLLKHDVPLYQLDLERNFTPLHFAVLKGKEEMANMFIEYGANVDACLTSNPFPLYLAAAGESASIVELLITKGANIHKKMTSGRTALHNACKNLRDKNITTLLEYGADINVVDEEKATPFSLIEFKNLGQSTRAVIRMFAKFTATNHRTNATDLNTINEYPSLHKFYEDCLKELNDMKELKMINELSYFTIFTKSQVALAFLIRGPMFMFPMKIATINKNFPIYCECFRRAIDRAEHLHKVFCCLERKMDLTFGALLPFPVKKQIMMELLPNYLRNKSENTQ